MTRILNNCKLGDGDDDATESEQGLDQQMLEENEENYNQENGHASVAKLEDNLTDITSWPPSMLEIDSLVTGRPITITINLVNGDSMTQQVDETSTVESVLHQALQTHNHFKKEHEIETFWLFRQQNANEDETRGESLTKTANQEFDYPLPKEKKILKLMYQAERQHMHIDRTERLHDGRSNKFSNQRQSGFSTESTDFQKCHFIIKKRIF